MNLDGLSRRLAALSERFAELGAKLGEAARELQEAGAPPADALVEELATARGQFIDLRADVLAAAESLDFATPDTVESLTTLVSILDALAAAVAARARRAAVEDARRRALGVLDRTLAVIHADDARFGPLLTCRAQAHALRRELNDAAPERVEAVCERARVFADLLAMIDAGDTLDDERYAQLEESVSRAFGRPLAVAAARGRLVTATGEAALRALAEERAGAAEPAIGDREPGPPEPVLELETETIAAEPPVAAPEEREPSAPDPETAAPGPHVAALEPEVAALAPASSERATAAAATERDAGADTSGPDETAQWWLAAWARWSGWKNTLDFTEAVREEIGKYPYLLSVPVQQSAGYEDGLLAYGYSIAMEHVERQKPGCIGNALNTLRPGRSRPVGEQLYDYLVTEGRFAETYAEFVRAVLLAALPEPGVWFQARIVDSRDDTRVFRRAADPPGQTDQTAQRMTADAQRSAEHRFTLALPPLTTRVVVVSTDARESRTVGVQLGAGDAPVDTAWLVTTPPAGRSTAAEAVRLASEGSALTLGREWGSLWIGVFNPDPARAAALDLGITIRRDARTALGARLRG